MTQLSLKGRLYLAIAVFLSLLTFAPGAKGQSAVDGAIGGNVLDGTGAVVSNASVSVHNLGTNAEQNVTTDASGYFRVIHLQPGVYNVKITAAGFDVFQAQSVTVQVGLLTDVEARLNVGSSSQTIQVTIRPGHIP